MRLRSDYRQAISPLASVNAMVPDAERGVCRVRIWEPVDDVDHPVVLVEELPENRGPSTVNAMRQILSDLFTAHRGVLDVETTLCFEYRPSSVRGGEKATLDQVLVTGWTIRNMPYPTEEDGIDVTGLDFRSFDVRNFETLTGGTVSGSSETAGGPA